MVRLFLSGDIMTGRGIDQAFARSCPPALHEPWVEDAREYLRLAERRNGPIPSPIEPAYIWGHGLDELERHHPDVRIVNLETSVTTSEDYARDKGIHYRMHPANVACLTVAGVDCCVLANNHVLDWGYAGLDETLDTLTGAGIHAVGAGHDMAEAVAPAVFELGARGRVLVFACGDATSGIPTSWRATSHKAGIHVLPDTSAATAAVMSDAISLHRRAGDLVVVSIHWGPNWGYAVPHEHREFAHALIDGGAVDVVHGHSSHHPKGIEVYRDRPILYGCGDLITDYEGISGHEQYRGDVSLMYFLDLEPDTGRLAHLSMVPMRLERFRLQHAARADAAWLAEMLNREGTELHTRVERQGDKTMTLQW